MHDHFGSLLCPLPENGDVSSITLSWLVDHGYQVIVIYRSPAGHGDTALWPSRYWPTPWPQTTSVPHMISFLKNGLSQRPPNAGKPLNYHPKSVSI